MIRSARDTACENFIIGLDPRMVLRVRIERPRTLQDAIMAAKSAEWEVKYAKDLFENREAKKRDKIEGTVAARDKIYQGNRSRSYRGNARAHTLGAGRGHIIEEGNKNSQGLRGGSKGG